jgi:hypothetical protein
MPLARRRPPLPLIDRTSARPVSSSDPGVRDFPFRKGPYMASLAITASIRKLSLGRTPLASLTEPFGLTELDSCAADCLSALSCTETKGVARKGWEAPKITRLHGWEMTALRSQVLPTAFIRSPNLQPP